MSGDTRPGRCNGCGGRGTVLRSRGDRRTYRVRICLPCTKAAGFSWREDAEPQDGDEVRRRWGVPVRGSRDDG